MTSNATRTPGERGTIEVRINGRRLTVSLARQLDVVKPERITPWGRVKIFNISSIFVVGEEVGSDRLVRSDVPLTLNHESQLTRLELTARRLTEIREAWSRLPLVLL